MELREVCVDIGNDRENFPTPHRVVTTEDGMEYVVYRFLSKTMHSIPPPKGARTTRMNNNIKPYSETAIIGILRRARVPLQSLSTWDEQITFTPDRLATIACASTIMANLMQDGHVWLELYGPASSGKTVTLNLFSGLKKKRMVAYIDRATVASISRLEPGAPLVHLMAGGTLIIRDEEVFHRRKITSFLRTVWDGNMTRLHLSDERGLRGLTWRGKIGLIRGVTTGFMPMKRDAGYGSRILRFNISTGRKHYLTSELDTSFMSLDKCRGSIWDVKEDPRIKKLAKLIVELRYTDDEIMEMEHRILYALTSLNAGMEALEIDQKERNAIFYRIFLSSIRDSFRRIIAHGGPLGPYSGISVSPPWFGYAVAEYQACMAKLRKMKLLRRRDGKYSPINPNPFK